MQLMFRAAQCCVAIVTSTFFFANFPVSPSRAADDMPMVGDIPMPDVHVSVNMDDDIGPPPPPRPHFAYPRGPYAALPPARFAPPTEGGPSVSPPEIARMLHSTGYTLLGQINRRGWVYTVSVINPRGDDGRAIIDARTGAVIRFIPAMAVNARLDEQLGTLYGPPGPPPVAREIPRSTLPPAPVPRTSKRDVPPKLADRMPVNSQPSVTSSIPSKPEPAKPEAAKSSASAAVTTGIAPSSRPAEQQAAPSPPAPSQPAREMKLWPTQAMPDVQPLD